MAGPPLAVIPPVQLVQVVVVRGVVVEAGVGDGIVR